MTLNKMVMLTMVIKTRCVVPGTASALPTDCVRQRPPRWTNQGESATTKPQASSTTKRSISQSGAAGYQAQQA
jgi:hypothetical protein